MKYIRNAFLTGAILVASAMTAYAAGPGQGGVVAPNSAVIVVQQ